MIRARMLLDVQSLSFAYDDQPVVRDVSLSVCGGEVVSLIGPNGSGKSTLIRCLLGDLTGSGKVLWEGRAIGLWRGRELARAVAYLPQSPVHDPEMSVGDVLRLGRSPYLGAFGTESPGDIAVVREVARWLELDDLLARRVGQLSGGQRQRVFIGRALAQQPRALLLDEPSTYMDLRHQDELARLLRRLAVEKGIGVLAASHELNVASMHADRMVLLDDGRVVADGTPDAVLDPKLLERVYGLPMVRLEHPVSGLPLVVPR